MYLYRKPSYSLSSFYPNLFKRIKLLILKFPTPVHTTRGIILHSMMEKSRALLALTNPYGVALTIRLSSTSALPQPVIKKQRKSKQKWGGITRDPYKTFQKRKDNERSYQQSKIPLKSEERSLREMDYPLNLQSIGKYYVFLMACKLT